MARPHHVVGNADTSKKARPEFTGRASHPPFLPSQLQTPVSGETRAVIQAVAELHEGLGLALLLSNEQAVITLAVATHYRGRACVSNVGRVLIASCELAAHSNTFITGAAHGATRVIHRSCVGLDRCFFVRDC